MGADHQSVGRGGRLTTIIVPQPLMTQSGHCTASIPEARRIQFPGIDEIEPYRLAASYVDRILRGAKPAELPVQAPTKYETIVNLKTAKTIGLDVPPSMLVRADEVIE